MSYDTVIRGGRVVTAADVVTADIGIRDGRIAALGLDLGTAAKEVDAAGLMVLPGGIDSHVHVSQPSGPGIEMADDFASASAAAAAGGNTTILPFRLPDAGQSLREAVAAYRARADGALCGRLRHPPDREGHRPRDAGPGSARADRGGPCELQGVHDL